VNAQHGHEKLPAYGSVVSGRNENNPSTGGSYGRAGDCILRVGSLTQPAGPKAPA
jgi:hypothetical protein